MIRLASLVALGAFVAASTLPAAAAVSLPGARDLGRLAAAAPVRLAVGLRLRDEAALDALLAAQSDPGSPLYRRFLTPAQVRDAFAPSAADYARTVLALRGAGFTIVQTDPLRTLVDVAAPAATVERYFATTLHAVALPGRAPTYTNAAPVRVPAEIAAHVSAVTGFTGGRVFESAYTAKYGAPRPHAATAAATPAPGPSPVPQRGPDGGYGPASITGAFDFPVRHGYFGQGVTVADLWDGAFSDAADIAPYLAEFGVKRTGPPTTTTLVDGGCGGEFSCFDSFSAAIDAQGIIGTAPGVAFVLYEVPTLSNVAILDGLHAIAADNRADVVNISFAGCETAIGEGALLFDQSIKLGTAQGITYEAVTFGGSHPCAVAGPSVQAPADSPSLLAVGGADTFVDAFGNVTNPPLGNTASGGGVSILFSRPTFQSGVAHVIASGRNLPDVAGPDAIDAVGPSIYFFGGWIGGQSFVDNAPVAGALAEEAQIAGTRLGLIDTKYYGQFKKYGVKRGGSVLFSDVTLGCNGPFNSGPYCAARGYDQISGLGVPDFYDLAVK